MFGGALTAALLGGSAIASLFGANQSANAATQAAKIQSQTADQNRALADKYTNLSLGDLHGALQGALGQFDQGQSQASAPLDPYANAGGSALAKLADAYGLNGAEGTARAQAGFTTSPGYQFRLDQGVKAIDRSANASGGLYSGGTLKALSDYGQGQASQEYGNYIGGLQGLAQGGQSAAGAQSGIAADFAGSRANALLGNGTAQANVRSSGLNAITDANAQSGAARAGGVINQANAWNGGLSNLATLAGTYMGSQRPPAYGAPAGRMTPANAFGF